jgi:two-component system sensor histidine kinase KdpD
LLAQEIVRRAGEMSVHIVPDRGEKQDIAKLGPVERPSLEPRAFAGSLAISLAGLGVGLLLRQALAVSNVALVLLVAVLASAVTFGLWPSLFACLLLALAYNFFFLPPLYTFTIADPENVITLLVFVLVAGIASNLTARVRMQVIVARQRAATTEDLYRFSRKLKTHWRRATSPPPNGLLSEARKPGAAPIPCREPAGCSCRCAPRAALWRLSAWIHKPKARC